MKKIFTIGTVVLGCCLIAAAQTNSDPNQGPPASFPGSSTDQSAPAMNSRQKTTVEGCLTRSENGSFLLSDASGNTYLLNDGPASSLGPFVAEEVRVDGFGSNRSSETYPGAMAAGPSQLAGSVQQIEVSRINKVANTCKIRPGSR